MMEVVLDTNVFISALRSKRGASFKLLSLIDNGNFRLNISVPLFIEYESVAKREGKKLGISDRAINDILNYLLLVSRKREIFFLWRPILKDPKDDLVLEVAVESNSEFIISYNKKDFKGSDTFGIEVLTPKEFMLLRGLMS